MGGRVFDIILIGGVAAVVAMILYYNLLEKPEEKEPAVMVRVERFQALQEEVSQWKIEMAAKLKKKSNQIERLEALLDKARAEAKAAVDIAESVQDQVGGGLDELRRSFESLDKRVVKENEKHRNWQSRMLKYTMKNFSKRPLPIEITNRPSQKQVKAVSRWTKNKDGSYTKRTKAVISYPDGTKKTTTKKKAGVELVQIKNQLDKF